MDTNYSYSYVLSRSSKNRLIGYLNKLVQFHMMNILNEDIYERIAASTDDGNVEEWNQYMQIIDQQDVNYKN